METSAARTGPNGDRSRKSALRTVDVARRAGYSVQQIRDLEREGVLPPAERTSAGYRVHSERHVRAAPAYKALAAGMGPVEARRLLRAAREGPTGVLARLDEAHARLHAERRDLTAAREAAGSIAAEPIDDPRPSDAMTITELAAALGVRSSTLRHWDAEGLVSPPRAAARSPRSYSPAHVRDARMVHQLRQAGYRIAPLRILLPQLREAGHRDDLLALLTSRAADIDRRSRSLVHGAALLHGLLEEQVSDAQGPKRTSAPTGR